MITAVIVEPTGESDTPIKFTAGLLLGISLDAEIYNLTDVSNIRVQVKYPDQQVHLICPRKNDFRSSGVDQIRLLTTIRISHHVRKYDKCFKING
jgi:integrator complex subunit 4